MNKWKLYFTEIAQQMNPIKKSLYNLICLSTRSWYNNRQVKAQSATKIFRNPPLILQMEEVFMQYFYKDILSTD